MTNLQIYIDEFQILNSGVKNFLTERWKRLMFLAKKANREDFIEELYFILKKTNSSLDIPLSVIEGYYQTSYSMPRLSKGELETHILLLDLRFMEIMHELSEMLKLEIVPSRMIKGEVA